MGVLMASINMNIILIALPSIFDGIDLNPLSPGVFAYLLWILMGYTIVTAVILVTIGRLSDMFGRVRLFNLGFVIFTLGSILLFFTPNKGDLGALELVVFRIVQAIGGAFLMANSTAIITDNFSKKERGFAMGINQIAATTGMSLGIVLGGVLSVINWRYVFLISIPVGILGTIWSYLKLKETSPKRVGILDIPGNLTFGLGLVILLVGVTYGLVPYKSSPMGWGSPWVITALVIGTSLLITFPFIEGRVKQPMFRLGLFKIRGFAMGSFASMITGMGMMGIMFVIILLFQGTWLPLHGYSYSSVPFWAGIFMLPMTVGMGIFGPIGGKLSDKHDSKDIATIGLIMSALAILFLTTISANFLYVEMAVLLFVFGAGYGMFNAPNASALMSSVPPEERGVASGMFATMRNIGTTASMGIFFTILIVAMTSVLPHTLFTGLNRAGVNFQVAKSLSSLPPTDAIFSALLGINPIEEIITLLHLGSQISPSAFATITKATWFPGVFAPAFMSSIRKVFYVALTITLIGALISYMRMPSRKNKGIEGKNEK
jgi:MFS family permease